MSLPLQSTTMRMRITILLPTLCRHNIKFKMTIVWYMYVGNDMLKRRRLGWIKVHDETNIPFDFNGSTKKIYMWHLLEWLCFLFPARISGNILQLKFLYQMKWRPSVNKFFSILRRSIFFILPWLSIYYIKNCRIIKNRFLTNPSL